MWRVFGRREQMSGVRCSPMTPAKTWLTGMACLIGLMTAGCGTLDQGPGEPTGDFFPLTIGNRWTYAGEFTVATEDGLPFVTETRQVRSIVGTEECFGRQYVLEKEFNIDEDGDTLLPYRYRYRQDGGGLYLADIEASEPPLDRLARSAYVGRGRDDGSEWMAAVWDRIALTIRAEDKDAYNGAWEGLCLKLRSIETATGWNPGFAALSTGPPGGVLPEEITLLKYPLHPSQQWVIRDDPFYVGAAVRSREVLDLPPGRIGGYKIRVDNSLFGPNDWAYVWYGRRGFLGSEIHVESDILDQSGNPMGTMVADDRLYLETLTLIGTWR
jgi:hypothetical protein